MVSRLVFDRISKRYGAKQALHSLSLKVEAGEIYGFLGPNGAGKSTAIHLAMGFLLPTGGGGELLGQRFSRARAARARVGYVPDAPVFFPGTAMDAVLLAGRLNGSDSGARATAVRERAYELLRWLDLPAGDNVRSADGGDARKFSRGMQQRLALAQALVHRPELLILDEPTSALDPPGVQLVREALARARDEGVAVFLSSHQLREVEQLCDRAAFLDDGHLLHSGPMADLLQEGAVARITLRGLGPDHQFVNAAAPQMQAGKGRVRGDLVFAMPISDQRAFLEKAWLAGAELVAVEREHRTLEDLFASTRASRGLDARDESISGLFSGSSDGPSMPSGRKMPL